MAQSTEEYLDSLLRQAMGVPDPEPETKPEEASDLERDDVLAMADGLTGSHSAILGNAYDHNASFTNEGEIELSSSQQVENISAGTDTAVEVQAPQIPVELMPDPDAPVASTPADLSVFPEDLLPEVEDLPPANEPVIESVPEPAVETEFEPSSETVPNDSINTVLPDGPVIEPDGNLDIIPEVGLMPEIEIPAMPQPEAEAVPAVEEPVIEEPVAEPEPVIEEPAVEEPAGMSIDDLDPNDSTKALDADTIAALFAGANSDEEPAAEEPATEESVAEEPSVEEPATEPEPVIEETVAEPEPAVEEPAAEEPAGMSIDDLDPNDSTKALDPDTIAALFAGANADEEPAAEESVAEESTAEEPSAEEPTTEPEPVIEEPVAEPEPAVEEPAAEEPAGMSIDDLDPNDSTKALDPDTIAALFAGANADEEPAAEESAAEESTAEESSVEEPATEPEPVIEEAVAEPEPLTEEPATEEPVAMSIDDLDPNDSSKALDPDTIAALFAGANAEETPLEGNDDALEVLDVPMDDEDEPLMPDQEISDLLSTLGELSGDNDEAPAESEEAAEPAEPTEPTEPEAPSDSEAPGGDIDLGVDMFDTNLAAMLDDVTGSLGDQEAGQDTLPEDGSDLNDLLGSLNDESGDLSDIGDLLNKDENSELVDPNTETAEALFASDSGEDLFDIDNVIDEEENPKGRKKKKKKKKFSLFGKKKKQDSDVEVITDGGEEMLIDPELLDIPEKEEGQKKPGFFATLFAKLFEEVEDEDDAGTAIDQSAVEIAQEGAAENEAILAELEDRSDDKKKGKKEKKKKEKKDKKGKKGGEAEGEEGEEGAEDTKKKKKKEKKKKEKHEEPETPTRRLPRKKVVAIALFCLTIGIVITFLAFIIPYSHDMDKARKFYSTGEYQKTYEYMRGHKLTSDDQLLYDRTVTLLRIKRPYDSYQNYMKMGLRMEALNALIQGVQMCDTYATDAATLGIIDKYSVLSRQIYDELYNTFGVTVDKARSWIEIEGTPEYTRALYDTLTQPADENVEQSGLPGEEEVDSSVIDAEENDL
ncbi:MAG: hypothetical protein K6E49_03875 [Lachnospiraceae bacterium]|nr:hypothetical protein [Lachnospiraceae bacterium]